MSVHRNQRMSRRELAFYSALLLGGVTSKLSCESRKADLSREIGRFKDSMESTGEQGNFDLRQDGFNTRAEQLNTYGQSISSLALRDGVIGGGGLLLVVALWFSIKAFRSKLNKWRAQLRETTRRRERAERREDQPVIVPATLEPTTIATERVVVPTVRFPTVKPTPQPTPTPHSACEVNPLKQPLFDALKSKLNGLAGPVAEALIDNLDKWRVSAITRDPSLLKDLLESEPAEFALIFRRKNIKLSRVLEALNKKEASAATGHANNHCAAITSIEEKIEFLRTIALQRGIKPRDLVLQLGYAGFEARTAPGKGGNGHKILFYNGEIVRSADGRPRYVPHANDTPVRDIVLTEVIRTTIAFLEKRKEYIAAA